jgi:2-octaprenyl-6-methoxyphenol hydroxylase
MAQLNSRASMSPAAKEISMSNGFDSKLDYDIAIVGGGVVGATLASALKDSGLTVLMIEPQVRAEAIAKGQAYAIHLSSKQIWENIGVWSEIEPQVEYFNRVRMSDADCPHVVRFEASDLGAKVLGYVAEHRVLMKELLEFVQTCNNVDWGCPARVVARRDRTSHVEMDIQSVGADPGPIQTVRVRLAIGADGSTSQVRQQAQIKTRGKAYWQSCVVATIKSEKFHNHTAYERFWPSGPFAILPVSETHCRIVWTAPHMEAEALLALDDDAFIERLMARYGSQMGKLTLVGKRFAFPARLMHSCEYVRSRLALVGDAAHSCHPVGGQGLNLGIRDVGALAQVLREAQGRGEDIGSLKVLRRYQRWRRWENILSLGFTDLINLMFSNEIWPLVVVRRLGLWLMGHVPVLKVFSLRFMAGLIGKEPLLVRGKPNRAISIARV